MTLAIGLADLARGVRDPVRAASFCRRQVGRLHNRIAGCDVMAEDWDSLLIVDACRYDTFADRSSLPGRLESRRSAGSATREFVVNNFAGRTFPDTVYVSGNPFVSIEAADAFHRLYEVWRTDWNDDLGTVMPGDLVRVARQAHERYPNKRLVVHFMQPHHPFVGEFGRSLDDGFEGSEHTRRMALDGNGEGADDSGDGSDDRPDDSADGGNSGGVSEDHSRIWLAAADGRVKTDAVRRAYRENLDLVLAHVADLAETLDGKTVVTSDHGNLFDDPAHDTLPIDRKRFGHPKHATAGALVTVPWHVCPHEERRTITDDPPAEDPDRDASTVVQEDVEDRLSALGYR